MTELTDLNDTDALNTAVTGNSTEGNVANMGGMDNLFQATLGMLSRFRNANIFRLRDNTDTTKRLAFDLSGLSTGAERTLTVPNESARIALTPHSAGYLFGLTLSNNAVDENNDIDIAIGVALDVTNTQVMSLTSSLTKRLDASWAVGTGNGMLDGSESVAGTPDVSTWYHIYLIKRVDTGVVDVLASESSASPTLPTNYTLNRRIGAVYNDASGNILGFVQEGDYFRLKTGINNANATDPGTSAVLRAMTVPNGVQPIRARGLAYLISSTTSAAYSMLVSSPSIPDTVPDSLGNTTTVLQTLSTAGLYRSTGYFEEVVNSASEVRTRVDVSDANLLVRLSTLGWVDTRGRTR